MDSLFLILLLQKEIQTLFNFRTVASICLYLIQHNWPYNKFMFYFDSSLSNTCLVCSGHSDGTCYCVPETQPAHYYQVSQAVEVVYQPEHPQPITPQNPTSNGSYNRAKKDNVAYKLFNVQAEKIYVAMTGKKLDSDYKKYYYRKEYFLVVLSQFEREGKNMEAEILFEQELVPFMEKLEKKNQDEVEYLNFLKKLVKDHAKAFYEFNSGDIQKSLKTIFDYDNMRQKPKFVKALDYIRKVRKEMGLSF